MNMQKTISYICVTMVIISVFFVLIPNQTMNSTMKFILNIFLISIIVIPIIGNISKIDFSKYSEILTKNKLQLEDLKEKVSESNKKNLEDALKIVFSQNGYKDLDISININKDSETTEIVVQIPNSKNYNKKEIEKIVKQQTGITPKIEYIEK